MTTREFIQHLILNCELNDEVTMEVQLPSNVQPGAYFRFKPAHACHFDEDPETLIECVPKESD